MIQVLRSPALGLALAFTAPVAVAQIDVAICASASSSSSACEFTDVQAKLAATGSFQSVGIVNVTLGTPTLQQLLQYDALLCWTNFTPADHVAWGNVLADYVDAGGGVVVALFANSSTTAGRNIGGRWQSGYEVILDQSGTVAGHATLGTVHVPNHPAMLNVLYFDGGVSYRPVGTALAAGSTLIASWSDGKVLVAEGLDPKRIDLGFYPPSSDCELVNWFSFGDGDHLMANALLSVANAGGCTGNIASYCTSSTTTNGCIPAMATAGVPHAGASSGFTLSCTGVEGQKLGLIFYGINGPDAAPWAPNSTSLRCVKAPTQRTVAQSSGGTFGACDGTLSVDFLAFMALNPGVLGQPIAPGQQYDAQAWFRDPPAPKATNLSDGVRFFLCP
jgi:hypothetical protein